MSEDKIPRARLILAVIAESDEIGRMALTLFNGIAQVELKMFARVSEFQDWVTGREIGGILVDLKTMIRARADERFFINSLVQVLPIGKIRLDSQSNTLVGTVGSQTLRGDSFVQHMLSHVLKDAVPRKIRHYFRTQVILNLKVYHDDLLGDMPCLTSSVDLSEGGLFFILHQELPLHSKLHIEIHEFQNPEKILSEVRWCLPWGNKRNHHPGVGIRFLELSESQRQQIYLLIDSRV